MGMRMKTAGIRSRLRTRDNIKIKIVEQDEEQDVMEDEYEEENNSVIYEDDEDEGY